MFGDKSKKIISFVLVFCLVFSIAFIPTRKADAGAGAAVGACLAPIVGAIVASLVSPTVPNSDYGSYFQKCLDGLIFAASQEILNQITEDMVEWINSGFDGNPAFVQDYNKLLSDVGDEAVGEFIENTPELAFLCSPFQLEIKKALIRSNSRGTGGKFERDVTCRLSDVTSNVDNFLNGDFIDGGWDAWRELSFDNPYSAYLKVSIELQGSELAALGKTEKEVEIGRGFLSFEKCVDDGEESIPISNTLGNVAGGNTSFEGADQQVTFKKQNCTVETPGSVIEQQLNQALPSGVRKLETADSINEIVDALFAYLVNTAVTKGLSNFK